MLKLLIGEDGDYPRFATATMEGEAAVTGLRLILKQAGRKTPVVILGPAAENSSAEIHLKTTDFKNAYPVLNTAAIDLAEEIARHYFVSPADVLQQTLPPVLTRAAVKPVARVEQPLTNASPLNERQRLIFEAITNETTVNEHLIWGVTGSGKTRIYEHLIADTLARGEQALLLVPEIALSGQVMEVITARFPAQTLLYHSGLAAGERLAAHRAFLTGEIPVAIGTRSAVFLPAARLGLIIIDEEHDGSFKDQRQMRFDTRTVARLRCLGGGGAAKLVLGSATPSLDSLARAKNGTAKLHRLRERATGQDLPAVFVPDYKVQHGIISPFLQNKMREHLKDGKQVLLLMNRRGHSTHVHCPECERRAAQGVQVSAYAECPRCSVALTYHKDHLLRCHQCGYSEEFSRSCPKDGAERRLLGRGIQRVEEILDHQFAEYQYARLDRDTAKQKNFVSDVLAAMRERKIDILIGTQMIAKGFDLAGVTLVGVLAIDQTLNAPDFRAAEHAWQLLAQVVGRSGRHEPGEVVIQTMSPHHPAIIAAATHDADKFYAAEADHRRLTGYPPFGALARIILYAADETKLFAVAEKIGRDIAPANTRSLYGEDNAGVELLGPALPSLARADSEYRVHFLIKGKTEAELRVYLARVSTLLERARRQNDGVRLVLDIDPREVN